MASYLNHTRTWLAVALLSITCAAHAKKISIYERVDEFKGSTVYFTDVEQPKLDGGSFVSMRYVLVSFMALAPITDKSVAYTIKVDATFPNWMFISSGESLVLKADGEFIPLSGPGSAGTRDVTSMGVKEVAYYSFSQTTLKKLAAAKTIQFRLYGDKSQITGTFTERMMEQIRFFADKAPDLIKDTSSESAPAAQAISTEQPTSPTP